MFWQVFLITRQLDGAILQLHSAFRRLPVKALTLPLVYFATARRISAASCKSIDAIIGLFCNCMVHFGG
ncbi:MAG: hypothetical protein KBS75_06340 [Bacteroidales bacterium]|nr:hypothetical protein [Candidatus Equimonas faecalis]